MRSLLRAFKPSQWLWAIGLSNTVVTLTGCPAGRQIMASSTGQHLPAYITTLGFSAIFFWGWPLRLIQSPPCSEVCVPVDWTEAHAIRCHAGWCRVTAVPIFAAVMFVASIIYFIVSPLNHAPLGTLFFTFPLSLARMSHLLESPDPIRDSSRQSALIPPSRFSRTQWGKICIATACQALSRNENPINH